MATADDSQPSCSYAVREEDGTESSKNQQENKTENEGNSNQNRMDEFGVSLIGFIGAGNLARILMKGFMSTGLFGANDIIASDIKPEVLKLSEAMEVNTTSSNTQVVQSCNVVIVAVEPQDMPAVLHEIQNDVTEGHLIISVAAGMTTDSVTKHLTSPPPHLNKHVSSTTTTNDDVTCISHERPRVVRVMTNTPTSVQAGVSVYSLGKYATERDGRLTNVLFSSVGMCDMLSESYMDAVTGVSGSGPAYAFMAIEALSDGGVKMGLPRDIAIKFAAQTLLGAAKMVLDTGEHPGQLKDRVTSPAGTTIAAVHELESAGFRAALINAVQAATLRSKELASEES